jgi:hypothetical protein
MLSWWFLNIKKTHPCIIPGMGAYINNSGFYIKFDILKNWWLSVRLLIYYDSIEVNNLIYESMGVDRALKS